jgi:hypothetical protein
MRVPQMVNDFVEWRWAPCVGLTAGSLAFVALALLLIPTSIGEPRAVSTLQSFDSSPPQRALYGSSLAQNLTEPVEAPRSEARVARAQPARAARSNELSPPPQRGFSPVLERPEPPAPEPPPPPAPPPVAPAAPTAAPEPLPGSVVVIQPVPGGESREVTVQ